MTRAVVCLASACLIAGAAYAVDNGQFSNVPPDVRAWFRSVQSPKGIPCCDIADGHRTTWRGLKDGGYEVPIEGEWTKVPDEAVVNGAGNPTGEAVVWYTRNAGKFYIRCFVPGGGA